MASAAVTVAKVLVVGDVATGKTSFIQRFCRGHFSNQYTTTIGVDFSLKTMLVGNRTVKMQLWDIAGQERFTGLARIYYKDASAAFVVYDISDPKTFASVEKWQNDIVNKVFLPGTDTPIPTYLIGNKVDLADENGRKVETAQGEALAAKLGFAGFFETSAKSNLNITESCTTVAQRIIDDQKTLADSATLDDDPYAVDAADDTVQLDANTQDESGSGGCC